MIQTFIQKRIVENADKSKETTSISTILCIWHSVILSLNLWLLSFNLKIELHVTAK